MVICGIDPGLKGGIAFLHAESDSAIAFPLPLKSCSHFGTILDYDALRKLIASNYPDVIYCEHPLALPRQSTKGTLNFGITFGTIIAAAHHYRFAWVRPQTWQAAILGADIPAGQTKDLSILHAAGRFPGVNLVLDGKRVPSDGIADALCIAEYGMREAHAIDVA